MKSDWTKVKFWLGKKSFSRDFFICLKCDLWTCTQTQTIQCIDSINRQNLSISECTRSLVQQLVIRICPVSDCLEW